VFVWEAVGAGRGVTIQVAVDHREVEFEVDDLREIEAVDARRALRELALELGEDALVRDVPQAGRRT
jgi:hypothetical protein